MKQNGEHHILLANVMASSSPRWQLTARDREILAALDLCPLESKDLLRLSESFSQPFGSLDRVRKTLKRLESARQVRSWRYATTSIEGGASPLYFKLTLDGYRTLHQDEDASPPTKRYLSETSIGRHHHQQCLTQFIVKTHISAHQHGLQIENSFPENTYRIETPYGPLFPDRRFSLCLPSSERFSFCVELDNSTETLVSRSDIDSIELKMKKYLHDLAANDYGYRVLFVVTRSPQRQRHIRELTMKLQPQVIFAPFYVVQLSDYLAAKNPFLNPIFASSRTAQIGLLRSRAGLFASNQARSPQMSLLSPVAAC